MQYTQPEAPTHRSKSTRYTQPEVYEYISRVADDPIVERKTCAVSGTKFPITQKDLEFYEKVSPVFAGKKYSIPTPTLCPEERQKRRMAWRNERNLYKRKCDRTGKPIMSIYHPESHYVVYSQDAWRGDAWSAYEYGQKVNRESSFFKQLKELMDRVPKISNLVKTSENCVYNVIMGNSKDCYLCSTTFQSEQCCYDRWCVESVICIDCSNVFRCTHCYECIDCAICANLLYAEMCSGCSESMYLYDCQGCTHCLMCTGLRNKQYCYKNQQLTKEEYMIVLESYDASEWDAIKLSAVRESTVKVNSIDGIGNNLTDCNACSCSFNLTDATRVKYSYDSVVSVEDCLDVSMIGDQVSWMYEAHACGYGGYKTAFSNLCWTNDSLYYCDYCMSCSHCFGCVGLQNASYCILNTQYTKEEYELLVPKIIALMQENSERGEFMPISMSPFGYNETAANDIYPLSRSQALEQGYTRCDYEYHINVPENAPTKHADEIPKSITGVNDDILNQIIICEISGKPFRIIKQELEFYRKHNLPLPTKHPDVRHQERLAKRPGRTLYLRTCDKTGEQMVSVYPQEFEGKVYSEKAYQEEVYG